MEESKSGIPGKGRISSRPQKMSRLFLGRRKSSPGQGHNASEGREVGINCAEEQQPPEQRGELRRTREQHGG